MRRQRAAVRLGVITTSTSLPVYDWLIHRAPNELARRRRHGGRRPRAMNRALLARRGRHLECLQRRLRPACGRVALVPGLSVAAHGRVESVLLFSWHADWRDLDGRSIALTRHSATSVALVRLLAERRYGAHPRYVTTAPDLDAMLAGARSRPADRRHRARRATSAARSPAAAPYVFDLAREWQAWTGLPFVFAVWAVRATVPRPMRARRRRAAARRPRTRGLADLTASGARGGGAAGTPAGVCADYLRLLDYELSARDLRGCARSWSWRSPVSAGRCAPARIGGATTMSWRFDYAPMRQRLKPRLKGRRPTTSACADARTPDMDPRRRVLWRATARLQARF